MTYQWERTASGDNPNAQDAPLVREGSEYSAEYAAQTGENNPNWHGNYYGSNVDFTQVGYDPVEGGYVQYTFDKSGNVVDKTPLSDAMIGASATALGGSAMASGDYAAGLKAKGQDYLDLYSGFGSSQQQQQGAYADTLTGLGAAAQRTGAAYTDQLQGIQAQQYKLSDLTGRQAQSAGAVDSRLGNSYSQLQQFAQQGPGPSAAEAQLRQANASNVAAQFALANSGRNAGGNAMALRNASATAADLGSKNADSLAALRAQETANWQSQKLSALSSAAGTANQIEGAQQSRVGLQQNWAQQNQSAVTQLAAMQGQGHSQNAANYQAGIDATKGAAGITSAANATSLAALQAGTGASQSYDQAALDIYTGNANRAAAASSQDKDLDAAAGAASQARSDANTDRMIGAAGTAATVAGTVYGGG